MCIYVMKFIEELCTSECLSCPAANLILAEMFYTCQRMSRDVGLCDVLGISKKCG